MKTRLSLALIAALAGCKAEPKPETGTPPEPATSHPPSGANAPPTDASAATYGAAPATNPSAGTSGAAPATDAAAATFGAPPATDGARAVFSGIGAQAAGPPIVAAPVAAPEKLTAAAGSTFVVSLPGNITTGFSWKVVEPLDPHLELVEQTYETTPLPDDDGRPRPGAGGTAKFTFRALSSGLATFTLAYARPWEKRPAEVTRSFEVTIP